MPMDNCNPCCSPESFAMQQDSWRAAVLRILCTIATGGSGPSENVNIASIGGTVFTLGQKAKAGSISVTLASDQGALPVSQSGNWDFNLAKVGGAAVSLGQALMAASVPVVLASNQTALSVTQSTSPWVISGTVTANAGTNLNTSLLALETGGNLATLAGGVSASNYQVNLAKVGGSAFTQGQHAAAGSLSVVLASDQAVIPISGATGTVTDGSGTIAVGGTSQDVFAVNASRKYLFIQNQSTGNLYVNLTSAAVVGQPSILLTPGGGYYAMESNFISTEKVTIIGATTGQAFTAKQG